MVLRDMATPAERETADRSVRDTARHEMPRALRDEVRLVGDALGQVIAEHGGEGCSPTSRRCAEP